MQGDSSKPTEKVIFGRKSEVVDNIVPQLKDDFLGKNGTEREAEILTVQQSMEVIAATNQQLAASLLRQSLPKCHPDTFSGDVTIFHPCKNLFKAMICDADISHALLGRLRDAAKFEDKDKKKLQEFADLCADVDYQIGQLPGLRCLNYVNVLFSQSFGNYQHLSETNGKSRSWTTLWRTTMLIQPFISSLLWWKGRQE